ncbi:hypothetical protein KDK95_07720 [Actinospica sp. MGRD01-02]|uniref:Glycosyltransferase RgtA/B/C/D-like domain-containing protein n=1 Tax=Actinospica acidithermotolerans TaxID=2828514 RepID=A0A941IFC7_9ACTN|nr:hypothetical protein [Actinospica acidithermotolerans]MBR7826185.1 hypothetical protein [Actinospica acidithermotolerans]
MSAYIRRYLLVHGAYLAVVLSLLAWYGLTPGQALARFDGQHYIQIASSGYVHKLTFLPDGKPERMNIAFYPLYPMLMAALHAVTRMPMEICGLVLSLAASLATAVGIGVLLEPLFGRRTAMLTVTIWAVGVEAIVQSMLYAQPLIAAFAVWGAIAVRRRRPLLAAACAIGAGLSHSTGLGMVVVAMAGSALLIREAARKKEWRAALAPAAAFVLAPMGLLGYIAFLALRFHRLDAWFLAESAPGWSSEFDFGKYTLRTLLGQLDTTDWFAANGVPHLVASLWIVPGLGITLWLLRDQGWWPERYRRKLAALRPSPAPSPSPLPSPSQSQSQSPSPSQSQSQSPDALDASALQPSLDASVPQLSPLPDASARSAEALGSAAPPGSAAPFGPGRSSSWLARYHRTPALQPSPSPSQSQSQSPSPSPAASALRPPLDALARSAAPVAPNRSSPSPSSQPLLAADRPPVPWELTVFSLVTFAVILTNSGPWGSKPRFLIPCVALSVAPAIWLRKLDDRPRLQQGIVLAIGLVSALCSAYMDGPSPSAL